MHEVTYISKCNGKEIPTAGWLIARRHSDGKEMFVTAGNTDGQLFGMVEGTYTMFESDTFEVFRK